MSTCNYKTIIGFGVLAKTEASYNAGASLSTSTDGVQATEPPVMNIVYSYDGARPTPPGTAGQQAFASPTGETCEGSIVTELRGLGSAYSTSSLVPNVDTLLQAAGFTSSISASGWLFTPDPVDACAKSAAFKVFSRQESYQVSGSFTNFEITTNAGAPATANFSFMGLPSIPTDEALPTITYNDTLPPKTSDINFVWDGITDLKVRSFSIALNREMTNRQDLNAVSGSAGFAVGRRAPTMTLTIESPDFNTQFNPHQQMKDKDIVDWSVQIGSVQYNRYKIGGKGQITGVTRGEDGSVATLDLEIALVTTTGAGNDDIYIYFD